MNFEDRLNKAIQRGQTTRRTSAEEQQARVLTEEQWRQLHSEHRLDLSERIERCLRQISDHFPGFRYQTVVGDDGWGAKISRDDWGGTGAKGNAVYSRLELAIRPYSPTRILELTAKGTIRNKEIFHRNHFQKLADLDRHTFSETIDMWVLEFAERFAAVG